MIELPLLAQIQLNATIEKAWKAFWIYCQSPQQYLPIFQTVKNIHIDQNGGKQQVTLENSFIIWTASRDNQNKVLTIKHDEGSDYSGTTIVRFASKGNHCKMTHQENLTNANGQKTTLQDLMKIQQLLKQVIEKISESI